MKLQLCSFLKNLLLLCLIFRFIMRINIRIGGNKKQSFSFLFFFNLPHNNVGRSISIIKKALWFYMLRLRPDTLRLHKHPEKQGISREFQNSGMSCHSTTLLGYNLSYIPAMVRSAFKLKCAKSTTFLKNQKPAI